MIMTKAFLYDSLCGTIYRCMFAGIDSKGHAQWVRIDQGEQPITLDDHLTDEQLEGTYFCVLAMEGELARSSSVAKALSRVTACRIGDTECEMVQLLRQMQELGIKWERKPLKPIVVVMEDTRHPVQYSYYIEDGANDGSTLAFADGFDSLEELFRTIRTYLTVLTTVAGITCCDKELHIDDKLRKEAKESDLSFFENIKERK